VVRGAGAAPFALDAEAIRALFTRWAHALDASFPAIVVGGAVETAFERLSCWLVMGIAARA